MSRVQAARRVASGLTFPTSMAFDAIGTLYVAESGLPLAGPAQGRVLRVEPDGELTCLKDSLRPPVNGLTYWNGDLYISEGGSPGRISVLRPDTGEWHPVLDGLPGGGNYHTNAAAFCPDGTLYFGQGSATNSGVVGPDNPQLSWTRLADHPHDIPGRDVVLTGTNVETDDPRGDGRRVRTGAFQPFGTPTVPGQRIPGRVPCTSAVMRCRPDGSNLELVAWGLRNPYGLHFLPDGRLLALDLGINDRGSRPVGEAPSCLYEIKAGAWYGWPDFAAGVPVTHPALKSSRGAADFLLANHESLGVTEPPLHCFEPRTAPTRMAYVPEADELVVALFGDKRPVTGPEGPRAGRRVVRLRLSDGSSAAVEGPDLSRPIDVVYRPRERALYVLDFGEFELSNVGEVRAGTGTGVLWLLPFDCRRNH